MKKQTASKKVIVIAMASVMGFSCLVGCNGAKKEQPATSVQTQQVTPDSKGKAEESTTNGGAKKADDKKSTTDSKTTAGSKSTTNSKSTTESKSTTDSKNSKDNKKGGKPANNSNTAKSGKTTTESKK